MLGDSVASEIQPQLSLQDKGTEACSVGESRPEWGWVGGYPNVNPNGSTGCARPGGMGGQGGQPLWPTVPPSPAVPSQSLTHSAALVVSTQIWTELGVNPASVLWSPEWVLLPLEGTNEGAQDEPLARPSLAQERPGWCERLRVYAHGRRPPSPVAHTPSGTQGSFYCHSWP